MTYTLPWYYPTAAIILAIALTIFTWRVVRSGYARWKIAYAGLIAAAAWIILVPGTLLAEIEVTAHGARTTRDMPLATKRELEFGKLESIDRGHERNRWGLRQEVWTLSYKDGRKERFDLGDLWRAHADEITAGAMKAGVRITNSAA
jgi:hypothetical protein